MCILICKPKKVRMPKMERLKTCWDGNPDGAGFAYAENGTVHLRKGFMEWADFRAALLEVKDKWGLPFMLHFRISTSGGVTPGKTHPYPVTDSVKDLEVLDYTGALVMGHNGILSHKVEHGLNDTQSFIISALSKIPHEALPYTYGLIESAIGSGNRIALLWGDGAMPMMGSGWLKEDGVWFSNAGYKTCTSAGWKYGHEQWWDEYDGGKVRRKKKGFRKLGGGLLAHYENGSETVSFELEDDDEELEEEAHEALVEDISMYMSGVCPFCLSYYSHPETCGECGEDLSKYARAIASIEGEEV